MYIHDHPDCGLQSVSARLSDAIYSGSNNWVLVQINGYWFKLNSVNLKINK